MKNSKLRVLSCESKTLALSKAELSASGELQEDDKNIMAQNQVALIAVCELINKPSSCTDNSSVDYIDGRSNINSHNSGDEFSRVPPIIIGTTHLKSSKSRTGERYRYKGILQVFFPKCISM